MTDETPDTSVVVAGLSSWHPDHDLARPVLAGRRSVIAHVLTESYSVLTRLPAPRRLDPALAITALMHVFPDAPITLTGRRHVAWLRRLADLGIHGGATYDALIAETAKAAGQRLCTLDARARSTYVSIGAEVRWLG